MRRFFSRLLLVSVFAFVLSGCLPTNTPSTENETQILEESAVTPDSAEVDVSIDLQDFSFAPSQLTAKAGETFTIELTSNEGFHDFVIDELDVASKTLSPGEKTIVTIEIPADASGKEFTFYCSVMNHRAQGMEGTLRVE